MGLRLTVLRSFMWKVFYLSSCTPALTEVQTEAEAELHQLQFIYFRFESLDQEQYIINNGNDNTNSVELNREIKINKYQFKYLPINENILGFPRQFILQP